MSSPTSGENRPDMVEAARKFMLTPKVRDTPFEEQRQFLLDKGVSESEIAEARASIPQNMLSSANPGQAYANPQPQPVQNRFVALAQSAVLIGSVSYAGYRFMRSFVLPRFFDIPDPATEELRVLQGQVNDLQNSIKFVMDSVSQTTQALAHRDSELGRVEAGISTIKSLLLSHNNFAPIVAPTVSSLPSWQQSVVASSTVPANVGKISPAANQRGKEDELEEEFVDSVTDSTQIQQTTGKDSPV